MARGLSTSGLLEISLACAFLLCITASRATADPDGTSEARGNQDIFLSVSSPAEGTFDSQVTPNLSSYAPNYTPSSSSTNGSETFDVGTSETTASGRLSNPREESSGSNSPQRRPLIPRRTFSSIKHERPYNRFLNYGNKRVKPGIELENEILRSKVETLGSILKLHVHKLRQVPGQAVELVFLVDSSSSVGADNFLDELKFVKKLLADFTVSYNQTRVAVITFSSQDRVKVEIDHVSSPHPHNHKCALLEWQMPRIRFMGGGTYTMGAMLEAQRVLASARPNSVKAVFLVTDGYSNGGDPRPAAEALRRSGATIFTFGIRNGNVKVVYSI